MNKYIVFSVIIFLLLSFVFLSATERKQEGLESQNWWVVYFEDPKSNDLDFIIENNSNEKSFRWEAMVGNEKISGGNLEIKKGEKKIIPVELENKGKIEIIVVTGEEKKSIYKNL